jgi:hypothetical protein
MPIDPREERWLQEKFERLDKDVEHLFVAAQRLSLRLNTMEQQLKVADSRNKTLWALATALFLSLLASLNLYFSSAGALDANVKANTKQIQDLQAVNKALGTEFHEHERRTSVPKAETPRQP